MAPRPLDVALVHLVDLSNRPAKLVLVVLALCWHVVAWNHSSLSIHCQIGDAVHFHYISKLLTHATSGHHVGQHLLHHRIAAARQVRNGVHDHLDQHCHDGLPVLQLPASLFFRAEICRCEFLSFFLVITSITFINHNSKTIATRHVKHGNGIMSPSRFS